MNGPEVLRFAANLYRVPVEGGYFLVDAGLPWEARRLLSLLQEPPRLLFLTHHHLDHAGGARALWERFRVPVLAHPQEWAYLTKTRRTAVVVLDMPLLDTRRGKDLLGTFLSDIVLQVLSFVAENERTNIRQRQAEGIAAAKARGIRFGRPPKPLPDGFHQAYQQWKSGALTGTAAARMCKMPLSTFRYRAEIYENVRLL